tara:strand:+ start:2364 stop:2606 length:243 start_codon:yes stop_codon:yes gene_type:complete
MKLVWENDSPMVQAPTRLRAAWTDMPDVNPMRLERVHPITRMGVGNLMDCGTEAFNDKQREQLASDIVNDLVDWDSLTRE